MRKLKTAQGVPLSQTQKRHGQLNHSENREKGQSRLTESETKTGQAESSLGWTRENIRKLITTNFPQIWLNYITWENHTLYLRRADPLLFKKWIAIILTNGVNCHFHKIVICKFLVFHFAIQLVWKFALEIVWKLRNRLRETFPWLNWKLFEDFNKIFPMFTWKLFGN